MIFRGLIFCLVLGVAGIFSCGKKAGDVGGSSSPTDQLFNFIESALVKEFISEAASMVMALDEDDDDADADLGDSLLFTGTALGVVSCKVADRFLTGLERMQDVNAGYLVRFNPLPPEYVTNPVSRDGVIGVLFGLSRAEKRCPDLQARIQTIKTRWKAAIGSSPFLHPKSTAVITPSLKFFMDVSYGSQMSTPEYTVFMASIFTTAESIKLKKSACYPIHLQTLEFLTLEVHGKSLQDTDKKHWCSITDGMGLMLTDWYCGRNSEKTKSWLKSPENSQHVYMHQRCVWESPDIGSLRSPRVDYLVLSRLMKEGSHPWK